MNLRIIIALCLGCLWGHAQAQNEGKSALVKGKFINGATKEPANDVLVSMPALKLVAQSDGTGSFQFSQVPYGDQYIVVGDTRVRADTIKILINSDLVDLGDITITPVDSGVSLQTLQIPTIALEDNSLGSDDDGVKNQAVSGLLTASRDPFQNTMAYVFGVYRIRPRGYDRNEQQVYINGAPMNDIETGDAYWSQWGGLNDVFRTRNNTYGLQTSDYAFGGINGTVYFDATAANQRKQTRITYSAANRQYTGRVMVTQSSGLMKNGWAYSISASRRWANEGYIPGTFYDGYSFYGAASKKINSKHQLNFTGFGAPTERGKQAPATQEAADLAGSNFYNPNWGYQNGDKRNAKVSNSFQPTFILNHDFTPSEKTHISTSISYQFGKNGGTTLDWYNAPDPRPDYYGYLPSVAFTKANDNTAINSQYTYDALRAKFLQSHQVNWDDLYNVNYINRVAQRNADGTLNGDTLRRSLYVLANDIDYIHKYTLNINAEHIVNEHIRLNGGYVFMMQNTESYRRLDDLLGGDYYLNINQFAERNYSGDGISGQNNLNNPNQKLHVGDKYYYDYKVNFNKTWAWAQTNFTYNHLDFFVAGNIGINSFSREGLFRNGLYPTASYGKSAAQKFTVFGVKGGVTYKLDGRNYLFLNGAITQDAPTVDNTYISPRTRSFTVDNPHEQQTYTTEGGYLHRAPKTNIRVVGFVTDVVHATEVKRFYSSETANTFVNYVMQDVATRYLGTELAFDYKVLPELSVTAVANIGQAFYTNNPNAKVYNDNYVTADGAPNDTKQVFIKDYYLGVGPQSAYTLGLKYNSRQYWYLNVNFNYFNRSYVDIAADRRSIEATDNLVIGSAQWHSVVDQEKLSGAFTTDVFGGKSILLSKISSKVPGGTLISINAGINNIFNVTNFRTSGFENLRYDYQNANPSTFPNKYFYAYGRNFFVNVSLKF